MSTRGAKPPIRDNAPVETASGLNGGGFRANATAGASQAVDTSSIPQAAQDPRAKASRHGKVTAEHANQGPSPRHR